MRSLLRKFSTLSILVLLFPVIAHANLRPVVSLAYGYDQANVSMVKNISLIAPFYNTYNSTNTNDTERTGSLFVGVESPLYRNFLWQIGLSYYVSSAFLGKGVVQQFGDPNFGNLLYQYKIQNNRIMVESKVLATLHKYFHPYVVGGIGQSNNNTYGYVETPVASNDVAMPNSFASTTKHSFSYLIGVGIDVDLTNNLRLGASYRYAGLGKAGLGTIPNQASNTTITYNNLTSSEYLLQLSYVG